MGKGHPGRVREDQGTFIIDDLATTLTRDDLIDRTGWEDVTFLLEEILDELDQPADDPEAEQI